MDEKNEIPCKGPEQERFRQALRDDSPCESLFGYAFLLALANNLERRTNNGSLLPVGAAASAVRNLKY